MTTFWTILGEIVNSSVFVLTVIIFGTYLTLMIFSAITLRNIFGKTAMWTTIQLLLPRLHPHFQ